MGRIKIPSGAAFRAESKPGYGRYAETYKGKNYQVSMDDIMQGFNFAETLYTSPLVRDLAGGIYKAGEEVASWFDDDGDPVKEAAKRRAMAKNPAITKSLIAKALEQEEAKRSETEGAQRGFGAISRGTIADLPGGDYAQAGYPPFDQPPSTGAPAEIPATSPTGAGIPPAGLITPPQAAAPPAAAQFPLGPEGLPEEVETFVTPENIKERIQEIRAQSDKLNEVAAALKSPQMQKSPKMMQHWTARLKEGGANVLEATRKLAAEIDQLIRTQDPAVDWILEHPSYLKFIKNFGAVAEGPEELLFREVVRKGTIDRTPQETGFRQIGQPMAGVGVSPGAEEVVTEETVTEELPLKPTVPTRTDPVTFQEQRGQAARGYELAQQAIPLGLEFEAIIRKQLAAEPRFQTLDAAAQERVIQQLGIMARSAAPSRPAAPPTAAAPSGFSFKPGTSMGQAHAIVAALARSGGTGQDFARLISEGLDNVTGVYSGGWGRWLASGRKGGYFANPDNFTIGLYQTFEKARASGPKAEKAALASAMQKEQYRQIMGGRPPAGSKAGYNIQLQEERLKAAQRKNLEAKLLGPTRMAKEITALANAQIATSQKLKGLITYATKTPTNANKTATKKALTAYEKALRTDSGKLSNNVNTYNKQLAGRITTADSKARGLEENPKAVLNLTQEEQAQLYGDNRSRYHADVEKTKAAIGRRAEVIAELKYKASALKNRHYNLGGLVTNINGIKQQIREGLRLPVRTSEERTAKEKQLTDLGARLSAAENQLKDIMD